MADRGPQRSEDRSVTDKDREASDALHVKQCPHGGRDACLCRECRAEAIAAARAEVQAELDSERDAHEATKAALHERDRGTVYVGSTARTITAMIERIVLAGEDAEEVVNDYGWEWKRGPDLSPLVALKERLKLAEAVCEFMEARDLRMNDALAAWRAGK